MPSALNALWDKINALEASFAAYQKSQLTKAIIETQKETEAAKTDAEYDKASADNAADLRRL